jgi:hypothetical protein
MQSSLQIPVTRFQPSVPIFVVFGWQWQSRKNVMLFDMGGHSQLCIYLEAYIRNFSQTHCSVIQHLWAKDNLLVQVVIDNRNLFPIANDTIVVVHCLTLSTIACLQMLFDTTMHFASV